MSHAERDKPVPVPESGGGVHPLTVTGPKSFDDQPVVGNRHGLQVPRLGLGTWRLSHTDVERIVPRALEAGYRHIDTAQMYGNEAAIGRAIAASGVRRNAIFVTTKVANENHKPDALVRSVDESLDRLATDYVDLLLIHWPMDFATIGSTLAALAQVQAAGRAHHIGVSNFTIGQLEQVGGWAPIEVLQVECHPYLQQRELQRWCRDRDLVLTAYSPLAQGQVFDDPVLTRIGADHGFSAAVATLAWLGSQPGIAAIPRTSDTGHLLDNWSARGVELGPAELDAIGDLDRDLRLVDPGHAPW